uniref:Protein BLT4 n=1 Tax=Hordeum vulgare TaxID=4513 RepID=BLT4_HORVU|nr:RecName: Full=Protein BLT4; Flags: Precursor [Hordeum vulgare]CAA39887.1 BLT4 protein [Hordeum vulgare subsp. vulgare]
MARTAATKLALVPLVAAMLLVAADAHHLRPGELCLGPLRRLRKRQRHQPSAGCCSGVKRLAGLARSTADKQATCRCLKSVPARTTPAGPQASPPGAASASPTRSAPVSTALRSTDRTRAPHISSDRRLVG